nr:homeodomain-like protein [Tanacetum cinerariifolium]
MSRKAYNSIMKHELVYTWNNMVGFAKNLHVFVEGHQFLIDFIILENINEFVEKGLIEVLFGQPFKEHVGIVNDQVNGVLWFKIRDDKTIFNMPRAKKIGFSSEDATFETDSTHNYVQCNLSSSGIVFLQQWELSLLAVGTSSGSGNSITGSGNAL